MSVIRLCCGHAHTMSDVACDDGKVMCSYCFERVEQEKLWQDAEGSKWDVCSVCRRLELEVAKGLHDEPHP